MSGRARRQRGFSLLELLVAMVIMAFSLAALYQASGGAVRNVEVIELRQRAIVLAQGLLNARDSIPETGWSESGTSSGFRWRVDSARYERTLSGPGTVLHEVRVIVEWQDWRGAQEQVLTTLLPQGPAPRVGSP